MYTMPTKFYVKINKFLKVDFPNVYHAYQTAEGLRKMFPDLGLFAKKIYYLNIIFLLNKTNINQFCILSIYLKIKC